MEFLQGFGGFSAEVVTGHFGFGVAPRDDGFADAGGGEVGFAFGAADAQAGGLHAGVEFGTVKAFGWPPAAALDNVDRSSH